MLGNHATTVSDLYGVSDGLLLRKLASHSAASWPNTWQIKRGFESMLNQSKCPILAQIIAQYARAAINHRGNYQPDATDKDFFDQPTLPICITSHSTVA